MKSSKLLTKKEINGLVEELGAWLWTLFPIIFPLVILPLVAVAIPDFASIVKNSLNQLLYIAGTPNKLSNVLIKAVNLAQKALFYLYPVSVIMAIVRKQIVKNLVLSFTKLTWTWLLLEAIEHFINNLAK